MLQKRFRNSIVGRVSQVGSLFILMMLLISSGFAQDAQELEAERIANARLKGPSNKLK